MKAPIKWLKKYVDIDMSVEEFASRMILTGTEVEEVDLLSRGMERVVVGKITKLEKHPNADKLQICTIDTGESEPVMIVTGATNVFEGAYVPAALDGADLPCGVHIKTSKLRGVESCGMLCSGEELCIGDEVYEGASVNGIMILRDEPAPGTPIAQVLGLDDAVIDFKITANRGDCLSVTGLAREAAAVLDTKLRMPQMSYREKGGDISARLSVDVRATDLCPRYMARVVENVRLAPSPKWMRDALEASGVRAINNIVDITNYVMLEIGQPLHAFDLRHVEGGHIIVRRADKAEKIETLDEKVRELDPSMLVIADEKKPIALAGIMGGQFSGIEDDTATVVFESANFDWSSIRVTSRALGMRTESSARYEKGLPTELCEIALQRAMSLIEELGCGDIARGRIDEDSSKHGAHVIEVETERINKHLGQEIRSAEIVRILERLGFEAFYFAGKLKITVPYWRRDIEHFADIAEEIQRLYGYDRIPSIPPPARNAQGHRSEKQKYALELKHRLAGMGFMEAVNYSFTNAAEVDKLSLEDDDARKAMVRIINPLGEDNSLMRTMLIQSLLKNIATNQNRGNTDIRFFELNRVFIPKQLPMSELADEPEHVALAVSSEGYDFYTLKGVVNEICAFYKLKKPRVESGASAFYHPGRSAVLLCRNEKVGEFGQIHPRVAQAFGLSGEIYAAELNAEAMLRMVGHDYAVKPLPKYPAVTRDISVCVSAEQNIGPMMEAIERAGGSLLESVKLFDLYEGAQAGIGRKSVAFTLTMRSPDRTLQDADANKVFDAAVKALETKFGAELRK